MSVSLLDWLIASSELNRQVQSGMLSALSQSADAQTSSSLTLAGILQLLNALSGGLLTPLSTSLSVLQDVSQTLTDLEDVSRETNEQLEGIKDNTALINTSISDVNSTLSLLNSILNTDIVSMLTTINRDSKSGLSDIRDKLKDLSLDLSKGASLLGSNFVAGALEIALGLAQHKDTIEQLTSVSRETIDDLKMRLIEKLTEKIETDVGMARVVDEFLLEYIKNNELSREQLQQLYNAVTSPDQGLLGGFFNWLLGALQWVVEYLMNLVYVLGEGASRLAGEGFKWLSGAIEAWLSEIISWYTNTFIVEPIKSIAGKGGTPQWAKTANELHYVVGDWIVEMFKSAILYEPPLTAEKAWMAAKKYAGIAFFFGVIDAVTTFIDKVIWSLLRTKILGTGLGGEGVGVAGEFTRIVTAIYWSLGLGWLTWITFGGIFRTYIADPISRDLREKLKLEEPTLSQLQSWLRQDIVSRETFDVWVSKLGWSEEFKEYLYDDSFRWLEWSYIEDLVDFGVIGEDEISAHLRRLGFHPTIIALVEEVMRRRLLREWTSKYRSVILKRRREGRITHEDALKALMSAGMSENRALWALKASELELEDEIIDYEIKAIEEAFMDGRIDEATLRDRLADYIVDADLIDAKVNYLIAKREPRIRPVPLEKLEARKSRLETRVKSLRAQIDRLLDYKENTRRVYEARMNVIKYRIDSEMKEYEARVSELKTSLTAEFEAYRERTMAELQARIEYLRRINEIKVKAKEETLRAYETAETAKLQIKLMELYEELAKCVTDECRAEIEAKIEALSAMANVRIDEREQRVAILIERENAVTEAKIELLQRMAQVRVEARKAVLDRVLEERLAKLERELMEKIGLYQQRLEVLKAEYERVMTDYEHRIKELQIKLDEATEELEAVEQVIAERAS